MLGLVIFDLGGICFGSRSIYLFIDEYLEDVENQIEQTLLILAIKLAMHANGLEELLCDDGDSLGVPQELSSVLSQLNRDVHELDEPTC